MVSGHSLDPVLLPVYISHLTNGRPFRQHDVAWKTKALDEKAIAPIHRDLLGKGRSE